jgi:aryl-alcohol dehydrogenase-like predicted oxidoreductase
LPLPKLSNLTVGTGGVGAIGDEEQLNVIRRVMDQGDIWMHCANYGEGSFQNLKPVFAERPSQVPKTIFKLDGITAEGFRTTLRDFLAQTGLKRMNVGQICGFPLGKEPDAVLAAMDAAKKQGLVDNFIMDIVPAYCPYVPKYIRQKFFDGYVFYYSVIECGATPELLAVMEQTKTPILAMRIFAGGEYFRGTALQQPMLDELRHQTDCADKIEFAMRFALSVPCAVTAIAGTSKLAHLDRLLTVSRALKPLDPAIVKQIRAQLRSA